MSAIQNLFDNFCVLFVAVMMCGSGASFVLGVCLLLIGGIGVARSKSKTAAVGPTILMAIGGPLTVMSGGVFLLARSLAADVLVLTARETIELGSHAIALSIPLVALAMGLTRALARAFAKCEHVVLIPVAVFLVGGFYLFAGVSAIFLGMAA